MVERKRRGCARLQRAIEKGLLLERKATACEKVWNAAGELAGLQCLVLVDEGGTEIGEGGISEIPHAYYQRARLALFFMPPEGDFEFGLIGLRSR